MLYQYLSIGHVFCFLFNIPKSNGFICPTDGRWPHPADCEKFYTCNAGIGVEAWCGNGMKYDVDHGRCDLSKNIDCKNGERPNWIPPAIVQTELIADPVMITAPPSLLNDETEQEPRTTTKSTMLTSTQSEYSKLSLSLDNPVENTPCTFQGNIADQNNCHAYFACKDGITTRFQCPDKHLFDEYLLSCNDYRKVVCGNRPIDRHRNNPCFGQPNGWYADYRSQCQSYYLCTEQRQMKMDECPVGSKWNPQRLRCDNPRYIAAPCGYRRNNGTSLPGNCADYIYIQ